MGHGLSQQQRKIMEIVRARPHWRSIAELLDVLSPTQADAKQKASVSASVSRSITGLVERGLLKRVHSIETLGWHGMQLGRRVFGVALSDKEMELTLRDAKCKPVIKRNPAVIHHLKEQAAS